MKNLLIIATALFLSGIAGGQTIIYQQNFNSGFPSGYSQVTNASDGGWNVGTPNSLSSQAFQISSQGSGSIIGTNDDDCDCNKGNDLLITDTIDLISYSDSTVFLRFDKYYYDASFSGDQEAATVEVSTNGGTNWTVLKQLSGGIWEKEAVDLSAYAGQKIQFGFRYSDGGGWLYGLAIDNIVVEVPVQYDMSTLSITTPRYYKLGSGIIGIEAEVLNNGGITVTSFDMNYVINGDTTTDNITGVSIDPLSDYTFTIPSGFNPTLEGDYFITAFATNINGNADQNTNNDTSGTLVSVYDSAYQKQPLYEVLTSSSCGPCRPGNENFSDVMSNYPNQGVAVKFQQDFPNAGDPYATDESIDRRSDYYGVSSIPNMQIDGGWDGNANDFTASLHEEAYENPAFVKIAAQFKLWPDSQRIEVCYDISSLKNFTDKTLYAAILENKTVNNIATNGETEFFDVFKKWFPESDSVIDLQPTMKRKGCMTYQFQGDYRLPNDAGDPIDHNIEHSVEEFTDLNVAMWIQDDQTREVYQATFGNKIDTSADYYVGPNAVEPPDTVGTAVFDVNAEKMDVAIYPNPAHSNFVIKWNADTDETIEVNLLALDGSTIQSLGRFNSTQTITVNSSDLSSGIYFVEFRSAESVQYEKLILQK